MSNRPIHQYAIGQAIAVTVPSDVSLTNVSFAMRFTKPDGSVVEMTPLVVVGSVVTYTTVAGDLDQPGDYSAVVEVSYPSPGNGSRLYLEPKSFTVWPRGASGAGFI